MTKALTKDVTIQSIFRALDGNKKDQKRLEEMLSAGWEIKESKHVDADYKFGKTCCLGFIFLPLALLGKGKGYTEYVLTQKTKAPVVA